MVANLFISPLGVFIWLLAFICFVIGFMLGLAHGKPDKAIYRSLRGIPNFIFFQVLSLLKSRQANKLSVATTHVHGKSIEDLKK